jgi:hypothetical protein
VRTAFAAGLFAIAVVPLAAHHSLTEYDASRSVTMTLVVREFHFVNPHPYLIAEARVASLAQEWRLELDNRFELVQIGMSSSTFVRGDRLLVSGSPGHDQKPILYVRELDRPEDGFRYEQRGSTPRIARPAGTRP